MMKIKHLYDNRELVRMLLDNWYYDKESLDLLDQYRISSNAIYPFKHKGQVQLLRFSPKDEKSPETIKAELEFVKFLKEKGYSVPDIVPSAGENELEVMDTSWGEYSSVVFSRVRGQRLDQMDLTDEMIIGYGHQLGRLHALSQSFEPKLFKRVSYMDQLKWMDEYLMQFPEEVLARKEVRILSTVMEKFKRTGANYGLIHYDFELDNVFYDEATKMFSVIDFDDAVYHWYVMDIVKSIMNILEEVPDRNEDHVKALLLEGYTSVLPVDEVLMKNIEVFKRYMDLYAYVRCLRSLAEPPNNQPEWMVDLIRCVKKNMNIFRQQFGMEIK